MAHDKHKKDKHKRNDFADRLGYVGLRVLIVILSIFSIDRNLRTARFLGGLMWRFYHRGRQRALDNLRASFPEKDECWISEVGRKSFENVVMLVVEILFTPRLVCRENRRDYSRFKNIERPKWLMKEKRGLIMLTAHYGNFEIVGYLIGLFGFDVYSVARPLDNKYINKYLYGVRQRMGQKIVDKKGAAEQMEDIIREGGTLCFIADQDAGKKGVFVDFFGRKASVYKSIGLLAMTFNIPIVVGYGRRVDNKFFFEVGANRIILPEEWQDKDKPLEWITAEYTKAIEGFVRQDPTQYWWVHRRWKTRPKDRSQESGDRSQEKEEWLNKEAEKVGKSG